MKPIDRRAVLRGLGYGAAGITISLPMLEAMLGPSAARAGADADAPKGHPLCAFLFSVPMGVVSGPAYEDRDDWFPNRNTPVTGNQVILDYTPSRNLATIQDIRDDFTVIGNLTKNEYGMVHSGDAHKDGTGTFATGMPLAPSDEDPTVAKDGAGGPSLDWVLARRLSPNLPFPVLPVALGRASQTLFSYVSWSAAMQPADPYRDPMVLFRALFGTGSAAVNPLDESRLSVLDYVKGDIDALSKRLGRADSQRVAQHLDSIRTLERQIQADRAQCIVDAPTNLYEEVYPGDRGLSNERAQLFIDLQLKAVECGLTRFVSFQMASRADGRQFLWDPEVGAYNEQDQGPGHHGISHYEPDKLTSIVEDQLQMFRYYVTKLKSVDMGDDSTLFDHSMLFYAHEHQSGNSHHVINMPILLAGKAGGRLRPGKFVKYQGGGYARMFTTMIAAMGIDPATLPFGHPSQTGNNTPLGGLLY